MELILKFILIAMLIVACGMMIYVEILYAQNERREKRLSEKITEDKS